MKYFFEKIAAETFVVCFLVLKGLRPLWQFNPIALRKAKIVYNFGLSECNRVATLAFLNAIGLR